MRRSFLRIHFETAPFKFQFIGLFFFLQIEKTDTVRQNCYKKSIDFPFPVMIE